MIVPGHLAQRAKREAWAQWSLKRGVETLPESIAEFLQQSGKVELHRDAAVRQIIPTTSGWKVCKNIMTTRPEYGIVSIGFYHHYYFALMV